MTLTRDSKTVLGYCTNAYSGESWEKILSQLQFLGKQFKGFPLPIGFWIPARAVRAGLQGHQIENLLQTCKEAQLEIYSLNGFPQSEFHQGSIKESVFFPDWTHQDRLNYTLDLIDLASQIPQSQNNFGISTVPISWKKAIRPENDLALVVTHLMQVCKKLYSLEKEKNLRIHLDLEPEPFAYLETSEEVVTFFKDYLLFRGSSELIRDLDLSKDEAERVILDKIQICYDTCHAAIEWESPQEICSRYQKAGIQIGKVQISSALKIRLHEGRCFDGTLPDRALAQFQDDRYLHQVIGFDSSQQKRAYTDLTYALSDWKQNPISGEFRIHFHIPVYLKNFGVLDTTQDHIHDLISASQKWPISNYWEVETYTWNILPEELRSSSIEDRMKEELTWVSSRMDTSLCNNKLARPKDNHYDILSMEGSIGARTGIKSPHVCQ